MVYSERFKRNAFFVNTDGSVDILPRMPFAKDAYDEVWVQQLVSSNPDILPAHQICSEYSQLTCIGTEVPVCSNGSFGFIDSLFITPSGRICIVETKLYRNQESRRTVIAQAIDYAKELQKWDAEKLNRYVQEYFSRKFGHPYRIIDIMVYRGILTYADEGPLTDNINACLKSSDFLILIVGDGIRSNVEELADFINSTSVSFHLGLIELELYPYSDGLIVIPNVLFKTSVLERQSLNSQPIDFGSRKQPLSRPAFINTFAENGCYDPDLVSEFISTLETVDGITVRISPMELSFRFSIDSKSYSILIMTVQNDHADIYSMPWWVNNFLTKHGHLPCESEDFYRFYQHYIDNGKCKHQPYVHSGSYFARTEDVLNDSLVFRKALEDFINTIS